jgi:hypothetical protein
MHALRSAGRKLLRLALFTLGIAATPTAAGAAWAASAGHGLRTAVASASSSAAPCSSFGITGGLDSEDHKSDLTWFLDASARVSRNPDGVCVGHVEVGENLRHVLAEIRKWLSLSQVGPVVAHVGGDSQTVGGDA